MTTLERLEFLEKIEKQNKRVNLLRDWYFQARKSGCGVDDARRDYHEAENKLFELQELGVL